MPKLISLNMRLVALVPNDALEDVLEAVLEDVEDIDVDGPRTLDRMFPPRMNAAFQAAQSAATNAAKNAQGHFHFSQPQMSRAWLGLVWLCRAWLDLTLVPQKCWRPSRAT
jgi:hypothetical protein